MKHQICYLIFAVILMGCMEKNANSPMITIHQPYINQIIHHADSLIIDVDIRPKDSSISEYEIKIVDKKGDTVYKNLSPCQCAGLHFVHTKHSFSYKSIGAASDNSEFVLEICAFLNNGDQICKSVPFKMT